MSYQKPTSAELKMSREEHRLQVLSCWTRDELKTRVVELEAALAELKTFGTAELVPFQATVVAERDDLRAQLEVAAVNWKDQTKRLLATEASWLRRSPLTPSAKQCLLSSATTSGPSWRRRRRLAGR